MRFSVLTLISVFFLTANAHALTPAEDVAYVKKAVSELPLKPRPAKVDDRDFFDQGEMTRKEAVAKLDHIGSKLGHLKSLDEIPLVADEIDQVITLLYRLHGNYQIEPRAYGQYREYWKRKLLLTKARILEDLPPTMMTTLPSCTQLERRWYEKYVRDFDIQLGSTNFSCDGNNAKLALALYSLEASVYLGTDANQKLDFYKYVQSNVKHFRYNQTNTVTDLAAAAADSSTSTVTLYEHFFNLGQLLNTSTLVHEARHLQADDPGHVRCTHANIDLNQGLCCDARFFGGRLAGSGYNADVFFSLWLLDPQTKSILERRTVYVLLKEMLASRFNDLSPSDVEFWMTKFNLAK